MKLSLFAVATLPILMSTAACTAPVADHSAGGDQAASDAPARGQYDMNDGYIGGHLQVTAATSTSLTFAISVAQDHLPGNEGQVSGVASGADGKYTYTGEDCTIVLTNTNDGITIAQDGMCDMGANVTAAGTYVLAGSDGKTLRAGIYDNLSIAIDGDSVTGWVRNSVGDPAQGGATCEFTIMGTLGADQTSTDVTVTDGYDSFGGKLFLKGPLEIALQMSRLPNACDRVYQDTEFAKDGGYGFKWQGLHAPGIKGYRTVAADKAYFHDAANGPERRAYVVKGDSVQIVGGDASFPQVVYTPWFDSGPETTGFLDGKDLVALP